MGKPAARLGDMSMHGGTIIVGCPTVLIGGMPAARIGDMHVCPMMTPAGPAPIPHVGMVISLGSPMVLIGGMPAARMGDMAVCTGPPDSIAMGCMTVLIGEGGSGAAGAVAGGGGGAPASLAAHYSAATAVFDNKESTTKQEHWVEFQFVDKAGNPVSGVHYRFTDPDNKESEGVLRLDGTIRRDALKAGQCKVQLFGVSNAKWSKDKANVGEKIKLTADVEGFADGTIATIEINKMDIRGADEVVDTIETKVNNKKVEAEWEYVVFDEDRDETEDEENKSYSTPEYYFDVKIKDCTNRSGLLKYKHWIEIKLVNQNDKPIANEDYILYLKDGSVLKGKLDGDGYKKVEKIPPGKWFIKFPNLKDYQSK